MRRSPIALLALTVVLRATAADGQAVFLGPGAAFISTGGASLATKDLDARLKADGYPVFGQDAKATGIGGYRIFHNRVMLGAEITGLQIEKKPYSGRDVGVSGGFATLGIGFSRQVSQRVRIYPRLGLGAGGLTLWIRNADTVTFDAVLAAPQPVPTRTRLLTRDGGVIDLGGGAEFVKRGDRGFLVGLRFGILLAGGDSDNSWWTQNGIATNGPKASITGPYLRLTLGGAWRR